MVPTKRTGSRRYFLWLCEKVRAEEHREFGPILTSLASLSFFSLIPYDDNRGLDGLALRDRYKIETDFQPPMEDAKVFEVLIAIAERMSYTLYDPDLDTGDQLHIWFWRLLHNLHLNPQDNYMENLDKINVWLNRKYVYNGDGGLFPLQNPIEDQRNVEIWYQMQAYINEILF